MTRPPLPNKTKLLLALDGRQRSAVNKAAQALGQSVAAYIRGMIDERHPPAASALERKARDCKKPTHEHFFRGKFLLTSSTSITDMISTLQGKAAELAALRADGCVLSPDGIEDDYYSIHTDDAAVAKKHGMRVIQVDEEE